MLKKRFEILLPLQYNDCNPVPDAELRQTREELLSRFEAIPVQPGTVAGIWIHEKMRFEDSLVKITVDVDDTPDNRQFFLDLKHVLRQRFRQIEIYIISTQIEVI